MDTTCIQYNALMPPQEGSSKLPSPLFKIERPPKEILHHESYKMNGMGVINDKLAEEIEAAPLDTHV